MQLGTSWTETEFMLADLIEAWTGEEHPRRPQLPTGGAQSTSSMLRQRTAEYQRREAGRRG